MRNDRLSIAETFYSVQGEGRTLGVPAVFLRLAGCNLMCGGFGTEKDKLLHDGATWRCDTIEVWMRGKSMTFEQIVDKWKEGGEHDALAFGAHLVITGGEPLMQQEAIGMFLKYVENIGWLGDVYVEIETNGTVMPSDYLLSRVNQWNCSPKLENSGMPGSMRVNKEVIDKIALCRTKGRNAIFKFVISSPQDWYEVSRTYILKSEILKHQVYLMPAVDNVAFYQPMAQMVIDICKRECVNYSPREHIAVWNQKTGV